MWRILTIIGGLTFVITGAGVISDPECQSIDLGGSGRSLTFTCFESPAGSLSGGEMSASVAGWLAVLGGVALIVISVWPWLSFLLEDARGQPGNTPFDRQSVLHPQGQRPSSAAATTRASAPLDPHRNRVSLDTSSWENGQDVQELSMLLAARQIPYELGVNGDLLIYESDETALDAILCEMDRNDALASQNRSSSNREPRAKPTPSGHDGDALRHVAILVISLWLGLLGALSPLLGKERSERGTFSEYLLNAGVGALVWFVLISVLYWLWATRRSGRSASPAVNGPPELGGVTGARGMPRNPSDLAVAEAAAAAEGLGLVGPFAFRDWPVDQVPFAAAGIYAIWDDDRLIYVGMSGRGRTREDLVRDNEARRKVGLWTRLNSHASGRRSGDQFCVYVSDRLVLGSLTPDEITRITAGELRLDDLVRARIREHMTFSFATTEDGETATALEMELRRGGLGVKPFLNPARD